MVRGTSDASRRWVTPRRFPPCRAPRPMDRRLGTRPGAKAISGARVASTSTSTRLARVGRYAPPGTPACTSPAASPPRLPSRHALRPRQRAENCCLERAAQKSNQTSCFTPCSGEFPSLRLFARTGLLSSRNSRTRDYSRSTRLHSTSGKNVVRPPPSFSAPTRAAAQSSRGGARAGSLARASASGRPRSQSPSAQRASRGRLAASRARPPPCRRSPRAPTGRATRS